MKRPRDAGLLAAVAAVAVTTALIAGFMAEPLTGIVIGASLGAVLAMLVLTG